MVGWIMNEVPEGVPAQRVISSKGDLTGSRAFGPPNRMRELLEADGVTVSDDQRVDMKRYAWDPSTALSQEELEQIIAAVPPLRLKISARLLQLMHNDPASPFRPSAEK
jgi:methylated-DNA-protein-cysteine methyltransferase-like protein